MSACHVGFAIVCIDYCSYCEAKWKRRRDGFTSINGTRLASQNARQLLFHLLTEQAMTEKDIGCREVSSASSNELIDHLQRKRAKASRRREAEATCEGRPACHLQRPAAFRAPQQTAQIAPSFPPPSRFGARARPRQPHRGRAQPHQSCAVASRRAPARPPPAAAPTQPTTRR